MSRRSSNTVKLARAAAANVGTRLDKNGIPVLDDPRSPETNRLPKLCRGPHRLWRVGRRFIRFSEADEAIYSVTLQCRNCPLKLTETEVEVVEIE